MEEQSARIPGHATLRGIVTKNDTPVKGIDVEVLDPEGGAKYSLASDDSGVVTFPVLKEGSYKVSVSHSDYEPFNELVQLGPDGLTFDLRLKSK